MVSCAGSNTVVPERVGAGVDAGLTDVIVSLSESVVTAISKACENSVGTASHLSLPVQITLSVLQSLATAIGSYVKVQILCFPKDLQSSMPVLDWKYILKYRRVSYRSGAVRCTPFNPT